MTALGFFVILPTNQPTNQPGSRKSTLFLGFIVTLDLFSNADICMRDANATITYNCRNLRNLLQYLWFTHWNNFIKNKKNLSKIDLFFLAFISVY